MVTARLRDSDRKRVEFAAYDIAARVARRLVELAERFGEPDEHGVRISVALSQDELAGWVGASREAVAKALRVLRERGYRDHRAAHDDRAGHGRAATAGRADDAERGRPAARRPGVPVRLAVWAFHLLLPLAGLWLLLAVPAADLRWEHHPSHFWLVFLVAAVNVVLAVLVDRAARRHDDARLALIGLGFLAAALFFGLHAVATPGVLLGSRNGGFALATPVGLALAAVFTAARRAGLHSGPGGRRAARGGLAARRAVRADRGLGCGVAGRAAAAGRPDAGRAAERPAGRGWPALAVLLYLVAAVRFYLLYRRRRSVMLLSLITASVLLAESMVAVVLASNWQLTWWLWHVLMVLAFGYVGYSAYVTYQREGATTGLFDGIGTEQTVQAVRAEYGAALEALVAAVQRQEAGEISADEMALITAGMADPVRADRGPDRGARPGRQRAARRARADRPARRAGGDRARVAGAAGRAGAAAPRGRVGWPPGSTATGCGSA